MACKNGKISQHLSITTPGGVDLQKKLKVVNARGTELVVQYVKVLPVGHCVQVNTTAGVFYYRPNIITADELKCLEAAVRQTTKGSLMFSMEGGCFVTDGIIPSLPAAEQVASTINEADHLLASLTFGVDHITWKKTTSPVPTFKNPLDVRCDLLEAIGQMNKFGQQAILQAKISQAYSIYSKFSNVRPWPTLIMGKSAVAVASSGSIQVNGQLLEVDMRGLYTDWLGNEYFDDKAECCIEQEPFLIDFCKQHNSYLQKYAVLARLNEYATVIGLCLADPRKPGGTIETHKAVKDEHISNMTEDVHATLQRAIAAKEWLVALEKDLITRVFMCIHLAYAWIGEDNRKEAQDWALLAILYLDNMSSSNASTVLMNHLNAKAHLILAHTLDIGSNQSAAKNDKLTDEKAAELEQFLDHSELEHATDNHSKLHLYSVRAIETSLQQALASDDWETASNAAEIIAVDMTYSAGLSELPTHESTTEAWSIWKASKYGGLKLSQDRRPLLLVLDSMWAAELVGKVDFSNRSLLSNFKSALHSTQSMADTDAETQLIGFIHYLNAGLCLQKKDALPEAVNQSLASSLTALCCFCKQFTSCLPINWCMLTAAAALRLSKCCKELLQFEEIQNFKQLMEETASKVKSMAQSRSTVHLKTVLQNAHDLRKIAQKCQAHELLVNSSEIMLMAYTINGDKEKASIWERVLAVDRKNVSIANVEEEMSRLGL